MSRFIESLVSIAQYFVGRYRPFNVFITTKTSDAIAGVKTKLCTLHVEFTTAEQWNGNQNSLPQISVSCDQLPNAEDLLQVTEWQHNGSQSPQKTVYLNTEQALEQLTLTIRINIQRVKNVFFDEETLNLQGSLAICKCSYSVLPSTPKQIFVTDFPKSAHRGSTAEVTAAIHDSFGNLSGDRSLLTDIKVSSESLSTSSVKFLSRGLFQVMLKCNKIGLAKTRIECEFKPGETQCSEFEFMVKCPPPSPIFSSILPEDINRIANSTFEAGTAITFRVSVKDSFGHPILKEEREVNVGIAFKNSQFPDSSKEISSLTCKAEDNSNIYFLTLILRKAGNRKLQLFFNNNDCTVQELTTITLKGESISNSPVEVNVVPSRLNKLQSKLIKNNPKSAIQVNIPQTLVLTAYDALNNIIPFNDPQHPLSFSSNLRSINPETKKLQVVFKESAYCSVTFLSLGQHTVSMLVRDCLCNVAVADKLIAYVENNTSSHIIVPEDFEGIEEYEDDTFCVLEYDSKCDSNIKYKTISCYGYVKGKIIGPDHSRLNNINRTMEWEFDDEILEDDDIEKHLETEETILNVKGLPATKVLMIYGLIHACLRGQHYREQERKFDAKRQEWKTKSQRAFHDDDRRYAQECSNIKEMYSSLVRMCNKMASDEIFSFYNQGRGLQSIDLHELFAADERKLREFYIQLLEQKEAIEAMEIVDRARAEQDEAIEKLRERLQQIKAAGEKPPWLEVIVGAGHHSKGKQKIKPKVIEFLKKEEKHGNLPKAEESNVGSLVVTFNPYTGPEPCFGYYFCKKCNRSWSSRNSWVGKYQCCYECHSKCYPMKQSEYSLEAHQSVNPNRSSSRPADYHYQDLCEKCQELGRYCGY